ncbi:hypothetical protein BT63DRAFT_457703 [Microthyrium microscopicum]|uniref:BZIP domain-containing protein n=1 Tax=Microthyrium microscopicum TaxID=703497 RepID=A0A6A6U398_9PEZI|nr:hypothetical protein BT63DRAFT_457703 [Microthyrium microscopicum]
MGSGLFGPNANMLALVHASNFNANQAIFPQGLASYGPNCVNPMIIDPLARASTLESSSPYRIPFSPRSPVDTLDRRWAPPSDSLASNPESKQMSHHGSATGVQARGHSGAEPMLSVGANGRYSTTGSPALPHPSLPQRERSLDFQALPGPVLPPPRPSSQASTESDRRSSRTLASVHSMLNPSNDVDSGPRGRRRSAAQMEDDGGPISPPMAEMPLSRPGSSGGHPIEQSISPPGFQGSRSGMPRRILTPTLHRAQSAQSLNRIITTSVENRQSTGTLDAKGTPFLSIGSAMHTTEPGPSGVTHLPPMGGQGGQRQSFSYQAPTPPPPNTDSRRKSLSVIPQQAPPSLSSARASPTPSSYSSYSRSGQASPSFPFPASTDQTPPGSYSLAPSPVNGPLSHVPPVSLDSDGYSHGIPVVSAGQSTYELFSLQTGRGTVSLPVEVHVASRQADEKRKRNAGASARFRQRRKEKEREANATIDKLRDTLRQMTQDAQYYKTERDRYLEALKGSPGWERYMPRSPSPVSKRGPLEQQSLQSLSAGNMTPGSPQSGTSSEHTRPAEGERNTRRRTDAYSLPMPSPTAPQGPQFQSPFGPYSPTSAAPPQQQYPPQHPPYSPTSLEPGQPNRLSMNDIPLGARPNYAHWSSHSPPAGHT